MSKTPPRGTKFVEGKGLWCRRDGDRIVVGITPPLLAEMRGTPFVEILGKGTTVYKGEAVGLVQSARGHELEIESPVSGELVDVNPDLPDDTSAINKDPYGRGWLFQIVPSDPDEWSSPDLGEER